jgi:hypothetical protein
VDGFLARTAKVCSAPEEAIGRAFPGGKVEGMNPSATEVLATVLFGLAVLHSFCVKRFAHWAHRFPAGSVREHLLHFLAETEVVFGLWAGALFIGVAAFQGSFERAVNYIEGLN